MMKVVLFFLAVVGGSMAAEFRYSSSRVGQSPGGDGNPIYAFDHLNPSTCSETGTQSDPWFLAKQNYLRCFGDVKIMGVDSTHVGVEIYAGPNVDYTLNELCGTVTQAMVDADNVAVTCNKKTNYIHLVKPGSNVSLRLCDARVYVGDCNETPSGPEE